MEKDLVFFEMIYNHPLLKKEDYEKICKAHTKVEFQQGSMLLEIGKIAKEFYIIEKGLFRSFLYDYNGSETTTEFYCPDEILIESLSLFQRMPSKENFQAIADSVVWKIEYETFQELLQNIEGFREWGRTWATSQIFILKQRSIRKLIDPTDDWQQRPDMRFTQRLRASVVARSRFIEDLIIEQNKRGIGQYVILGAGLDTFAFRRSDIASKLQIYEIDQPDTLAWKQQRLIETGFEIPQYLHFVPVNFEVSSWWEQLLIAGFDSSKTTVIVSTGVTLYLTKEAIIATLKKIAGVASGSTLAMAFYLPIELLDEEDKSMQEIAEKGAKASGTPFVSFFSPDDIVKMSKNAGLKHSRTISTKDMEQLYFSGRTDNLIPASGEVFLLATT